MQKLNIAELSNIIKKEISALDLEAQVEEIGHIISVSDGIVQCLGLDKALFGEMVVFETGATGIVFNLEKETVGIVVLDDYAGLSEGQSVKRTNRVLSVPVGEALLGRVVNALGKEIDAKGEIAATETLEVERIAPGVIYRKSVSQPLQTGIKSIDSMVPVGLGQRELIIGDRQTGKTAIAVDTIINQKGTGVYCIYVAIGQKQSTVNNIVQKLAEHDALKHTIIVSASASDSAAMQFLAPYSGCAMGEYFRDRGMDALIVYDDLSKHAVAYRQLSLLSRRPPGREAFPGDVFYLHSRLLERAARVNEDYVEKYTKGEVKGKTGSLTALPVIETQGGDVSAFVPTNVISITDGQIYLEAALFAAGIRPAINAGLSVSRVGGAAQTKIIKKLGGSIRLALAQYRELAAFSQFASDLDEATKAQLDHGARVTEVIKQAQYSPLKVSEMGVILAAVNESFLQKVEVDKVVSYAIELIKYMKANKQDLLDEIDQKLEYSDEIKPKIVAALEEFQAKGSW